MIRRTTTGQPGCRGTSPAGRIAAAVLLATLAAACTAGGGATPPVDEAASEVVTSAPSLPRQSLEIPTIVPSSTDTVPAAIVGAAVADAAARAGVDPADVTVVSAEARDWPSGALGCPEMGFMYTDMITPGYRIIVTVGDTTYDYRASARGGGDVRRCERPGLGG